MNLDAASQRVIGALMEKEMTTPDAYPLSVNALIAASNQRSSRDPVMDLTEEQVRKALDTLDTNSLVVQARGDGRVARYEHRIRTVLNLRRDETALLCLLLLRGAQTVGELRTRSERMHSFEDLGSVQTALDRMAAREPALVAALPRAPGSREVRTMHLLGGAVPQASSASTYPAHSERRPNVDGGVSVAEEGATLERVRALEATVAALEVRLQALEDRLNALP